MIRYWDFGAMLEDNHLSKYIYIYIYISIIVQCTCLLMSVMSFSEKGLAKGSYVMLSL